VTNDNRECANARTELSLPFGYSNIHLSATLGEPPGIASASRHLLFAAARRTPGGGPDQAASLAIGLTNTGMDLADGVLLRLPSILAALSPCT
jgi:hypothetical protein